MYLKNSHFKNIAQNHMNASNLDNYLMTRLSSKAMKFEHIDGHTLIIYVNTVVFERDTSNIITLNTNGWRTVTSKKWINYGLGSSSKLAIKQKAFKWYVVKWDGKKWNDFTTYSDNMSISNNLKLYVEKQVASGRFDD